jgi:8-oxo-dGTP diphosphatase
MNSSHPKESLPHGHHVVAVAGAILRRFGDDLRVLALRRASDNRAGPGLWETVSGRVEHGEEPLAAVQREIVEESGLEVEVEPRPFAAYAAQRGGVPMIVILFRARWLRGEVQLSSEHDAAEWLGAVDFRVRCTLLPLVPIVERALLEPTL